MSTPDDGMLRVYECPKVLDLPGTHPDCRRCGFIQAHPGVCPYDHAEPVTLVEIVAVVLCSDCGSQILRDDCRDSDGRLICDQCVLHSLGSTPRSES